MGFSSQQRVALREIHRRRENQRTRKPLHGRGVVKLRNVSAWWATSPRYTFCSKLSSSYPQDNAEPVDKSLYNMGLFLQDGPNKKKPWDFSFWMVPCKKATFFEIVNMMISYLDGPWSISKGAEHD